MKPTAQAENPYASPAVINEAVEPLIHSFKRRNRRIMTWTTLAAWWLPPSFLATLAMATGVLPGIQSLLLLPPIVVASILLAAGSRQWVNRRYRDLGVRIAERLRREEIDVATWGGQFVQFSPAGELMLYDLHTEWDAGFLFLFADRLVYIGEQARFSLPRQAIDRFAVGYGSIEFPVSYQTRIQWHDTGRQSLTYSVWPGATNSTRRDGVLSLEFAKQIEQWIQLGNDQYQLPPWNPSSMPSFESVQGKTLRQAAPVLGQILGGCIAAMGAGFITAFLGITAELELGLWPIISAFGVLILTAFSVGMRLVIQFRKQ